VVGPVNRPVRTPFRRRSVRVVRVNGIYPWSPLPSWDERKAHTPSRVGVQYLVDHLVFLGRGVWRSMRRSRLATGASSRTDRISRVGTWLDHEIRLAARCVSI
jgi:hypothetical protein